MLRFFKPLLFSLIVASGSCVRHQSGEQENTGAQDSAYAIYSLFPTQEKIGTRQYSIFSVDATGTHFAITDSRPAKNDAHIFLCIAGAFTQLENNRIDGLYIKNGAIVSQSVNHTLGGGLLISENKISIVKTDGGKLLTQQWIDSVSAAKCSFFQQIQLVRNDSALHFGKDQKLFQRRAIVIYKLFGKTSVIESKGAITLQQFADDLVSMGVQDAIYTDMGSWDEGWYRSNDSTVVIGNMRGDTDRQSNWVILTK